MLFQFNNRSLGAEQNPPILWRDLLLIFGTGVVFFFLASYLELHEQLTRATASVEAWQLDELPLVLLLVFVVMAYVLVRRTRQLRKQMGLQVEAQKKLTIALDKNRRLTMKNVEIQEAERLAIARELHDEFGQSMNAIMIDGVAIRNAADLNSDLYIQAKSIVDVSGKLFSDVRGLLKQLRPVALDELGLSAALEYMIEDWRRRFDDVEWKADINLYGINFDETSNITIFRCVQEALTNIIKHSDATRVVVAVSASQKDGYAEIKVGDNGSIKEINDNNDGIGLMGLRERIENLGGVFEAGADAPSGFFVSARFPIHTLQSNLT
jgi:two-component system sensor histidine kinase UhpB